MDDVIVFISLSHQRRMRMRNQPSLALGVMLYLIFIRNECKRLILSDFEFGEESSRVIYIVLKVK